MSDHYFKRLLLVFTLAIALAFLATRCHAASFPYITLNKQTNHISDNGTAITFNGTPLSGGNWTASGSTNSTLTGNASVHSLTATNGITAGTTSAFSVADTGIVTAPNIITINNMSDTWNNAGTTFTAIKMSVTDTASGGSSLLLNLLGGPSGTASKFNVDKLGDVTAVGPYVDNLGKIRLSNDGTYGLSLGKDIPFRLSGDSSSSLGTANRFSVSVGNQAAVTFQSGTNAATVSAGGTLKVDTTSNGNTADTNEDTLTSFTVTANVLGSTGDYIEFKCSGTFAGNGDTKRLRCYFGSAVVFDSTALALNGGSWVLRGQIIRTGASTQTINADFSSSNTTLASSANVTTGSETLTAGVLFKCTGTAGTGNANDIVQNSEVIRWYKGQ